MNSVNKLLIEYEAEHQANFEKLLHSDRDIPELPKKNALTRRDSKLNDKIENIK